MPRHPILALVPAVCEVLRRVHRDCEFVFHTQAGRRWRNNVQRGFGAIVKRAGMPHCTLHDLRRTFVSHLAMAGVNEAVVKDLAGHASISTTLRYYTRIMPQALRSAQARLPFDGVLQDVSDTYHEPVNAANKKNGERRNPRSRRRLGWWAQVDSNHRPRDYESAKAVSHHGF